jgi:hypothetical protein
MEAECEQWKPRRILFLTGMCWARPFITSMKWDMEETCESEFVEARGTLRRTSVVVARHPQTRKEEPMVDAIVSAFHELGPS